MKKEFRDGFEVSLAKVALLGAKLEGMCLISQINEYLFTTNELSITIKEANKQYLLMTSDEKTLSYDWYKKWLTDKVEAEDDLATYDVDEDVWDKEYELFQKEHPEYFEKDELTQYGWNVWEEIKDKRMGKFADEIISIGGTVEFSEVPMELSHFEFAYKF